MTRWSEAKGRKIVDTSTAETVGKVDGLVVDPASQRVAALLCKRSAGPGDVLHWGDVRGVGADAVTVSSSDRLVDAQPEVERRMGKRGAVLGKRVLTTHGDELGEARDLEFDPESGAVRALIIGGGEEVAGTRLVGVGSYAVIVEAA